MSITGWFKNPENPEQIIFVNNGEKTRFVAPASNYSTIKDMNPLNESPIRDPRSSLPFPSYPISSHQKTTQTRENPKVPSRRDLRKQHQPELPNIDFSALKELRSLLEVPKEVPLFRARTTAQELIKAINSIQEILHESGILKCSDIGSLIETKNIELETLIREKNQEIQSLESQIRELSKDLINIETIAIEQEAGLYPFDHPAENSGILEEKLRSVREAKKKMVREKTAISGTEYLTYQGSATEGKKFVNRIKQLGLSRYNDAVESCIRRSKAGSFDTAIKRLRKTAADIEKAGETVNVTFSEDYLNICEEEVILAIQHHNNVKAERERERERRAEEAEQRREEKKRQAEIRREKEKQEKERQHKLNVLQQLKENPVVIEETPEELTLREESIQKLQEEIDQINHAIQDIDNRESNTKAGYVYVISNIGSFGESIVKIGMTRRLNPQDRIRELSSASVPFTFDTHLLMFDENASDLEKRLHRDFSRKRVNKVNERKEYFHITPQQVLKKLQEYGVQVVEWNSSAPAEDYYQSLRLHQQENPNVPFHSFPSTL